jgi:hypothetical protein
VLEAHVGEQYSKLFDVVVKRIAFPEWCEIELDPDDDQIDYI